MCVMAQLTAQMGVMRHNVPLPVQINNQSPQHKFYAILLAFPPLAHAQQNISSANFLGDVYHCQRYVTVITTVLIHQMKASHYVHIKHAIKYHTLQ
jgi:hypothetical protein